MLALAFAAAVAVAAPPADAFIPLPPTETLFTKVVEGDHSPPFDVARRNDKGEIERGTCVLTTGASVEVITGSLTKEALTLTCINECTGSPNHQSHAACDTSCDTLCSFRHSFRLTPREMPAVRDGNANPFGGLQSLSLQGLGLSYAAGTLARDITSKMRLDGEMDPMRRALFDSLEEAADWGDEFALNADFDDPEWDGPNPLRITVEHWNTAPCSYSRRVYGFREVMLRVTPMVDVAITTAAGTQHQLIRGEPVIAGRYWYPDSKPLSQEPAVVACKCRPTTGKIGYRPYYRIGLDYTPIGTRAAQGAGGTSIWDTQAKHGGLLTDLYGMDMNQFRLRVTNTGSEETEVALTPGTKLIPNDPAVQDMVVVEPVSLVCPPGATRTASLVAMAQSSEGKTVEKVVRLHCLEINKKEPSEKTTFTPAAPDDDHLNAVVEYFNKSRIRGVWDQARTWIYTDKATLEEINKRVLPPVTKAQYLNGLFDVAEAGAFDYDDEACRKLATPSLLLGTSASPDAKGWLIRLLAKQSPKQLASFMKENAALFAGSLGAEAGEAEIAHSAAVAAHLCAAAALDARQAGLTFLKDAVPAAQRERLAQAGALEGAVNLALEETGPIAAQAAETMALFSGARAKELLQLVAQVARNPEARKAAAAASTP